MKIGRLQPLKVSLSLFAGCLLFSTIGCENGDIRSGENRHIKIDQIPEVSEFWIRQVESGEHLIAFVTTEGRLTVALVNNSKSQEIDRFHGGRIDQVSEGFGIDGGVSDDTLLILWGVIDEWRLERFSLAEFARIGTDILLKGEEDEEIFVVSPRLVSIDGSTIAVLNERYFTDEGEAKYRLNMFLKKNEGFDKIPFRVDSLNFDLAVIDSGLLYGELKVNDAAQSEVVFSYADIESERFERLEWPALIVSNEADAGGYFWRIIDDSEDPLVVVWQQDEGIHSYELREDGWRKSEVYSRNKGYFEVYDIYASEEALFIAYREFRGELGEAEWRLGLIEVSFSDGQRKSVDLTDNFEKIPITLKFVGSSGGRFDFAYSYASGAEGEHELWTGYLVLNQERQ